MMNDPQIVHWGLCALQVCVPNDWDDTQINSFANKAHPTGIASRWTVRKEGHEMLAGAPERVPCEERTGCVHVMLEC